MLKTNQTPTQGDYLEAKQIQVSKLHDIAEYVMCQRLLEKDLLNLETNLKISRETNKKLTKKLTAEQLRTASLLFNAEEKKKKLKELKRSLELIEERYKNESIEEITFRLNNKRRERARLKTQKNIAK